MSIYTIYRICIWLPILVPAILITVVNAFDLRSSVGVVGEVIAYSLLWGGLPYLVLGGWATWWLGGKPEEQIRRLMFRAPLLMLAVFVPLALVTGVLVGAVEQFIAVAALGALVILLLGYAYVSVAVILRAGLGPKERAA
ncbi:MAG TPA: hypothetical protein VFV78_01625 [Vicinamibacterales bacterium]|nr:hypothetical protein [Vicinamibacterales bacterium]